MTRGRFADLDRRGVPGDRQVPILGIRAVMRERDVRHAELAVSVDLAPSELSPFMTGAKPFPDGLLDDIANVLGVPAGRLVADTAEVKR